jgi:hypothetical protein
MKPSLAMQRGWSLKGVLAKMMTKMRTPMSLPCLLRKRPKKAKHYPDPSPGRTSSDGHSRKTRRRRASHSVRCPSHHVDRATDASYSRRRARLYLHGRHPRPPGFSRFFRLKLDWPRAARAGHMQFDPTLKRFTLVDDDTFNVYSTAESDRDVPIPDEEAGPDAM